MRARGAGFVVVGGAATCLNDEWCLILLRPLEVHGKHCANTRGRVNGAAYSTQRDELGTEQPIARGEIETWSSRAREEGRREEGKKGRWSWAREDDRKMGGRLTRGCSGKKDPPQPGAAVYPVEYQRDVPPQLLVRDHVNSSLASSFPLPSLG